MVTCEAPCCTRVPISSGNTMCRLVQSLYIVWPWTVTLAPMLPWRPRCLGGPCVHVLCSVALDGDVGRCMLAACLPSVPICAWVCPRLSRLRSGRNWEDLPWREDDGIPCAMVTLEDVCQQHACLQFPFCAWVWPTTEQATFRKELGGPTLACGRRRTLCNSCVIP
jgi:hypothetical protein